MNNESSSTPSISIIRHRIDSMLSESDDDLVYQNAFRYLILGAARLSEIVGDYAPIGNDAHRVEIKGSPALLIVQKTARKKMSRTIWKYFIR